MRKSGRDSARLRLGRLLPTLWSVPPRGRQDLQVFLGQVPIPESLIYNFCGRDGFYLIEPLLAQG